MPGFAKTRLIPSIGAHAAAILQERLTERAVATALAAAVGPVTLWCAPDLTHGSFRELAARFPSRWRGRRTAISAPACWPLFAAPDAGDRQRLSRLSRPTHLRAAADALNEADVVLIPAEDGGYVLIGARAPHPELFRRRRLGQRNGAGGNPGKRIAALGLRAAELPRSGTSTPKTTWRAWSANCRRSRFDLGA